MIHDSIIVVSDGIKVDDDTRFNSPAVEAMRSPPASGVNKARTWCLAESRTSTQFPTNFPLVSPAGKVLRNIPGELPIGFPFDT